MKDEEMAEKWVDKEISLGTSMYNPQIEYYSKQAFLAGLKAGRPQWHKVADGDLPKDEGIYLVAWKRTVFDKKYGGKYGFQVDYFKNRRFEIVGEYAIAWCEIPTFDKE